MGVADVANLLSPERLLHRPFSYLPPAAGAALSAFATVEDLVSHLRASAARYRAAAPAEFLDRNQPPMFITLYLIVTRLPDFLRSVKDHFLSLDPTSLTIDLLELHLLAVETSAVAVGAAQGTPRTPFFEGCSPSPLAPSYASSAAVDQQGKGGKGGGGGSGSGGGGSSGGSGGGGSGGSGGGSGGVGGSGGGSGGSGGSGSGGSGGGRTRAKRGGTGGGKRQRKQHRSESSSPQQLREWLFQRGASRGSVSCLYVVRMGDLAGQTCGKAHKQHRCFSRLDDAWRAEFGDEVKRPHWADLLRSGVAIFDLDYDAILSTMYALSASAEGDCYRCVPPDPGIEVAALDSGESSLPGTAPAEALHTFTLDSGASRCFFRDSTTLTPLPTPVPVRLADPSGGLSATVESVNARYRAFSGSCVCSGVCVRSLPPLPPSPTPPCLPCDEGQQRAAPHSSSFPPTSAPLQTLHMDVWGPARVSGQGRERYFLLVVDDYTRYIMDFPLRSKEVVSSPPTSCGTFVVGRAFSICSRFPDSPQQNGIAERRIGLVMEVARTSMIHAAAPHFLWSFAVRYAAHQLNLWPRVSLPETSPTLRWTGEVGDASAFRVWGSRAFVRDKSAHKLSAHAIPYVFFVGSLLPSLPLSLFPPPPPPLFLAPDPLPGTAPVEVAVGSGAARGAASGGAASRVAEPGGAESEGAGSGGVELGDEEPRGAEPEGVEHGGAESEGAESGGAEPRGAASSGGPAGASPRLSPQELREWLVRRARLRRGATEAGGTGVTAGAGGTGGAAGAGPRGARTRCTGAAGTSGVGGPGGGDPTEPGAAAAGGSGAGGAGAGGSGSGGTGAGGAGARGGGAGGIDAGGAGAGGAGVGGTGAGGTGAGGAVDPGGSVRPRPYFVPCFSRFFVSPSPQPAPSPYTEQSGGLTERREPASCPVLLVHTTRRVPHSRPSSVPGKHAMALRPSSVPLRVPLPAPPESSLPEVPDPASDRARAASPTASHLLAPAVTDPCFESAAASALNVELLDFDIACRLDYATAIVAESESASPPSVGGECALCTDVLEDNQEDFECLAAAVPRFASMLLAAEGDPDAPDIPTPRSYAEVITGPYSSQWKAAMDAEMASWKSTCTYVDEVPPPGANIVDGMWIFRVKRPPGSPPAFKAYYVARGFSQRQGVDYFQTFSPTPKMTTLQVLLHVAAQRDYELHSLDFSTAFLQGSLHEEIWLRRPPGFTGSFPAGTQWSLWRRVYGLHQAPHKWHNTLSTTLAALGFAPSTADPSLFLRTDTSLPPFYVLVYVDDLVFATADTEALTLLKSELQKRHTCTNLGELRSYLGLQITRDRAQRTITLTQSHMVHQVLQRFGFQFSSPQPTPLSTGHSL
ncbi:unnamed protein product [Closterium sp. NIES-53]